MESKINDKEKEHSRYNKVSGEKIHKPNNHLELSGSISFRPYIQAPYIYYEKLLAQNVKPGMKVLDLCCGDGIHTITLAQLMAEVTALDIAENSITLAKLRALRVGIHNIEFYVGDAENLRLGDKKFDFVTCVGSLSYVDLTIFVSQVKIVLKPGGKFICLDSFNHNIIYRLNRFVQYLGGKRSWSTIKRMPNLATVDYFKNEFVNVEISYFGIFSFLGPLLSRFFGDKQAKEILDKLDKKFKIFNKYSFKFVLVATKT